jgi:hypothetical protein
LPIFEIYLFQPATAKNKYGQYKLIESSEQRKRAKEEQGEPHQNVIGKVSLLDIVLTLVD